MSEPKTRPAPNPPQLPLEVLESATQTAEEWWARTAGMLAAKMELSGVKLFKINRQPSGKYSFEVEPEGWQDPAPGHPEIQLDYETPSYPAPRYVCGVCGSNPCNCRSKHG